MNVLLRVVGYWIWIKGNAVGVFFIDCAAFICTHDHLWPTKLFNITSIVLIRHTVYTIKKKLLYNLYNSGGELASCAGRKVIKIRLVKNCLK